jgi:hypothetical protein
MAGNPVVLRKHPHPPLAKARGTFSRAKSAGEGSASFSAPVSLAPLFEARPAPASAGALSAIWQGLHDGASLGFVHRAPAGDLVSRARATDAHSVFGRNEADAEAGRLDQVHGAIVMIGWSLAAER